MAGQGTALLDFGAYPGGSDASVAVSAPTITGGALVEAWVFPADTADHLADEHLVETIRVFAGNVQAGVGFTIYGVNSSQLNEVAALPRSTGPGVTSETAPQSVLGGIGTRIYGQWTVAWAWN
jgi:hypothetical protein